MVANPYAKSSSSTISKTSETKHLSDNGKRKTIQTSKVSSHKSKFGGGNAPIQMEEKEEGGTFFKSSKSIRMEDMPSTY